MKEALRIPSGPRIKEISSNCSSIAASPPTFDPLYHDGTSDDSVLNLSPKPGLFISEPQQEVFQAEDSKNTTTWSALPGDCAGRSKDSMKHCKFMLDSDSSEDSLEIDGGSFDGKDKKEQVYARSISCDPVASGEAALPMGSNHQSFVENDFPLKVRGNNFV